MLDSAVHLVSPSSVYGWSLCLVRVVNIGNWLRSLGGRVKVENVEEKEKNNRTRDR
jgi:hypothetical protein